VILAPDDGVVPQVFQNSLVDERQYDVLLGAMQKMRGRIYLSDGAIQPGELDSEGRHVVSSDRKSWHVLSVDRFGEVVGCARYRRHNEPMNVEEIGVCQAPVARDPQWGAAFHAALRSEMSFARRSNLALVEVGGWAVEKSMRFTTEALRIALSTYALSRWLGGCIGLTTATVRNSSAGILRKIGGMRLEFGGVSIPPYFDPNYRCEMEVLRFDSRCPSKRFQPWVDAIFNQMAEAPVLWRRAEVFPPLAAMQTAQMQYRAAQAGR
jgi:hypothetical protein